MDYIGAPNNVTIRVNFNEEKTPDDVETIKKQIIQYFASEDFYQAIISDKRFEKLQIDNRDKMGYFRYGIMMKDARNDVYFFSYYSDTNAPVDLNDSSRWTLTVLDTGLTYSVYKETFQVTGGYSFEYLQITGFEDKEIQNKINQVLKEASTGWVTDQIVYAEYLSSEVLFQTEQYLCVSQRFHFPEEMGIFYPERLCFIIDMKKGERIFLNDLLEINDDFVEKFQHGDVLYATGGAFDPEEATQLMRNAYDTDSSEDVLKALQQCSIDPKEIIHRDGFTPFINYAYINASGRLCFGFFPESVSFEIYVLLDDIEEFLKVEKW